MVQVFFAIMAVLCLAAVGQASAEDGWIELFDGTSLKGWQASDAPGSFKVVDGAIACDGPSSHLFYVGEDGKADFRDFELSAEVKTVPGANSGIFFHTAFQPSGSPAKGFEVQVLNTRPTQGDSRENRLTGSLYNLRNVYKQVVKDNQWFRLWVRVSGKQVQVKVNDLLLVDYVEPTPPTPVPNRLGRRLDHGTFALQCHDPSSKVLFRNLRVRPLEPAASAVVSPALTDYEKDVVALGTANFPMVNYHVHLKGGLTLEQALALSHKTGIFYGIAVNCGLNFPVTNDAGIREYLKAMKGQPVFIGMQAEGREWVNMFSREAMKEFDYVFTDAMTIVDDTGRRMRLWIRDEVPEIKDKQVWMDMLVDRTVKILSTEPINLYVNPTYLPEQISAEYDQLWTPERMQRVAEAAAKHGVAIEINGLSHLPSPAFLKLAKAARCKFAFGTNNGGPDVGDLRYCFRMVKELGLGWQDVWVPGTKSGS